MFDALRALCLVVCVSACATSSPKETEILKGGEAPIWEVALGDASEADVRDWLVKRCAPIVDQETAVACGEGAGMACIVRATVVECRYEGMKRTRNSDADAWKTESVVVVMFSETDKPLKVIVDTTPSDG